MEQAAGPTKQSTISAATLQRNGHPEIQFGRGRPGDRKLYAVSSARYTASVLGLWSLGSYQAKLSYQKPRCVESEPKCSLFEYKIDDFASEDRE